MRILRRIMILIFLAHPCLTLALTLPAFTISLDVLLAALAWSRWHAALLQGAIYCVAHVGVVLGGACVAPSAGLVFYLTR